MEESLQAYEQALPLAEGTGDLDCLCSALDRVSHIHLLRGELALSRRAIERAIAVAEGLGNEETVAFETFVRGLIHFYAGEWGQARRDGERAVAVSRRIGTFASWKAPFPLLGLSHLFLAEGAWDEAEVYLEECVAAAERTLSSELHQRAQALLAERDLWDGRPVAARARLAPLLDTGPLEASVVTEVLPRLAWASLELGDVARAQEIVEQALTQMRAAPYRLALVDTLGVQARVAMRQERWTDAMGALDEGLDLARAIPYPYGEALLLHVRGLLHGARGESELAHDHLKAARAIVERLGARTARWFTPPVERRPTDDLNTASLP